MNGQTHRRDRHSSSRIILSVHPETRHFPSSLGDGNRQSHSTDSGSVAEDIAGAGKVAATLATAATYFAAPAGLLAVAATIGLAPKPLIVVLLPVLVAFAAGAIVLSTLAKLYAKSARRNRGLKKNDA